MKGLGAKKYIHTSRKRFDPFAIVISIAGLVVVFSTAISVDKLEQILDWQSLIIVGVGTAASTLFQYDFTSMYRSLLIIAKSFLGNPEKEILRHMKALDEAIINDGSIVDLRPGEEITGELLNDIVYMHHQGLLYEEIDEFVTARISEEFLTKRTAVSMLNRAAIAAPALGLLGTVMGLIGVLKSLNDPSQIGTSMSLALMTTAYGSGLSSLVFNPLAGRIEHQNEIFMEFHKQFLSKVSILLNREDRRLDADHYKEKRVS